MLLHNFLLFLGSTEIMQQNDKAQNTQEQTKELKAHEKAE